MQKFKSHKTVQAVKILGVEPMPHQEGFRLISFDSVAYVTADWMVKHTPEVGGYFVQYEDGYQSYSPAKAFEEGYKPVEFETMEQPKITGYRQLSKTEVDLMNEGKALAEACGAYIAKLRAVGPAELDQRWIAIGSTDLQKGWMSVIRGIAQPTTF